MTNWDELSAFEDLSDLDHVCKLLSDAVDDDPAQRGSLEYLTGEKSQLLKRLNLQAEKTEEILEAETLGLYRKTWVADLFQQLFYRLYCLTNNPQELRGDVPWLREALHKVLIAAHEVFDPRRRKALVESVLSTNAKKASAKSHAGRDVQKKCALDEYMARSEWKSIAAAVKEITPKVLEMKNISRPLARTNANRTVREWISKFIDTNPAARARLSEAARNRLRK